MKVLLLNEVTQPGAGGGCESHLAALWKGLEERGHDVRLEGPAWPGALAWADVVHVHNMTALGLDALLFACEQQEKPTVISLHDYWPFCPSRMAVYQGQNCHQGVGCRRQCGAPLPSWFETVQRAPCVSFTPRAAEIFRQHGIESTVIPHGINLSFWRRQSRLRHGGPVRVACCTAWGMSPWKGIHVAQEVEQLLGRRAEFRYILGGQSRETVRGLYWWADVVLVPSLYEETFCLVAAEAQACGRPVVGFAVGGLLELASATVPQGDVAGLARALLAWRELGLRPVRSYQEMAADYEALYGRVRERVGEPG
ncbi:MAG: glycosyltransferase [Chloroflexi bacterium]|nr:glycosyltransferase [Chloroflexota bacterium]